MRSGDSGVLNRTEYSENEREWAYRAFGASETPWETTKIDLQSDFRAGNRARDPNHQKTEIHEEIGLLEVLTRFHTSLAVNLGKALVYDRTGHNLNPMALLRAAIEGWRRLKLDQSHWMYLR